MAAVTSREILLASVLAFAIAGCASPQVQRADPLALPEIEEREDRALRTKLETLMKGFRGDVGIYVHNLRTGATVAIAADDTFPTASMVKVPLLITVFDQIEKGQLHLDSLYAMTDSTVVQADGDDLFSKVRLGEKFELRKLAFMMMSFSDNTVSVWIQKMIGGSQVANAWLETNGYNVTRDNSRLPERRTIWQKWGWGMTSPREMAHLVMGIRRGTVVSPEASERMYGLMTNSFWNNEALSSVPPRVQVASKQGAVDRSRSEVMLVNAPNGDYVFCLITKNNEDQSWTNDNEAHVLLRKTSWAVYQHFNPSDTWRPLWSRPKQGQ